ncbi:hypothetical protein CHLNCDRAFT_139584 [Chlorella variabilis]|uniref:Uncharacterized protein n=1 Tax=Chlorella variabilis TaxID=554065 RepID=E1ZQG7_CHLVA|nr:hypothetical protein CHLNCDRAFT_139584 [Chlorella variabilis]EFN52019.1 hypothetical protein CHLNCDRAFT_139584 [Chlorella variabilis]|eukprot:XP_005844121.1 hypothetical protein CHLNCDRAFT_139584 [Chlorella variabilis]
MPLAVLGALLVLPSMAEAEDTYNLAVNTARVWLTQMEEVAAEAQDAAATAGLPPVDLNFTITRDHSMQLEGYMVAADGQFPFGWSPSEIFYNAPALASTPLRLDACAVAAILTGDIRSWDDPQLVELNPESPLPDLPLTLVYLNLSMPITQSLTQYLSAECPAWEYGVTDNLEDVVAAWGDDLISSADVGGTWQAVNATPGAISIGGSMPVGQYVAEYPAAMQYAVLQVADGTFVPPDGQLNETAVAELAARAPIPANASGDWAYMYATPPGLYPILYWGFATVPRDLTAKGPRGHYIKDTVGYLLTEEGQAMVAATNEYQLPGQLMPAALEFWKSIKVSEDQVVTGIPTPASEAHTPTPAPAPSPASSSCRTVSLAPLLAVVAAAAAALALA